MDKNLQTHSDSDEGPLTKKLRSSDPDLKIIVGEGADQREYLHYAPIMASQSHFIDTMLASPMNESISGEIKLPDLAPKDWDRMMMFLEVENCHKMRLQDAVELVSLYNKYEFRQGLGLCEKWITNATCAWSLFPHNVSQEEMDMVIKVFEAIDAGGLSAATVKSALKLIRNFVKKPLGFCARSLSDVKLEHLVPLLQSAERSIHCIQHESLFSDWTEDEVNNPMFPRLFVKQWELLNASALLDEATKAVWVYDVLPGTRFFEGRYAKDKDWSDKGFFFFASTNVTLPPVEVDGEVDGDVDEFGAVIMRRHNRVEESAEASYCWTICLLDSNTGAALEVEYPIWVAPNSHHMLLPPKDGWIPAKNERVDRPDLSFPGTSPRIRYELEQ